jgi:hypothetical protein
VRGPEVETVEGDDPGETDVFAVQPRQTPESLMWLLSLKPAPRLLERMAVLPPGGETAAGRISVTLRPEDADQDGHEDIVIEIAYTPDEGAEPTRVPLRFLNRPGGLARELEQPEKALLRLANRSVVLLKRRPDRALSTAELALSLHAALCREAGAARVVFGNTPGLACGRSNAAGRALAVKSAALAQQGKISASLEAQARLADKAYRTIPRDRHLIEQAQAAIPSVQGIVFTEGPRHQPPTGPPVRLPALAFVGEETLLLRGTNPTRYELSDGSVAPYEGDAGDSLIRDPSDRFAVVDVHRTCEGFHLRIVRASQVVAGIATGSPVSEPLIEKRAPPWGTRCASFPANLRDDDGGYRVLGWPPGGIVVARGAELRRVPLDEEARPVGEPRAIAGGEAPPAPLPPGAATADGRFYALLTPAGIVIHEVHPSPRTLLIRSERWDLKEAGHLAVSPSGKKIAFLHGDRVVIASR